MPSSPIFLLLFSVLFFTTCRSQQQQDISKEHTNASVVIPKENQQIAEYIREIFQDKDGNLWFGTNGYGVAHYNGDSISYFSNAQGFGGRQITGITEDLEKNIWFATDQGVVKYDWSSNRKNEKMFTNYTEQKYFGGQRFWSIFADSKNTIWAGSADRIFRFDGENWKPFEIPYGDEVIGEFITRRTTWSITEDTRGNMWFSTNGHGAFKYEGKSFTNYSKKDGLSDDSVDIIMEDGKGHIWFGTRWGGVSRYDGKRFTNYLDNDEVCIIYEDSQGRIWISSEGNGVYRLNEDGESFSNYALDHGLGVRAVQTIFEDKEGRFWVGGGGGLYRFDGVTFFYNVRKDGPWD